MKIRPTTLTKESAWQVYLQQRSNALMVINH